MTLRYKLLIILLLLIGTIYFVIVRPVLRSVDRDIQWDKLGGE